MDTTTTDELAARLDERTSRGLARAVSAAVADGALGEGDRLPPVRAVARDLGLSPSTVAAAWGRLARAGTIRTDGRRGTTVAGVRAGPTRYRRALAHPSPLRLDLSTGVPDAALLPDLRPAVTALRTAGGTGSYLDDPVVPGLEEVLRADWPSEPEVLTVVDGAMDALDLLATTLLHPGDTVVVEHPAFPPLLDLLDALGVRTVGVAVDRHGMVPDGLAAALPGGPVAVLLQPRAHNPTGASMTPDRARALADVVRPSAAVVVEDDSAGAVATTGPVSLGRWLPDRTVHVRSFSKSHGPDLRLAAVGGPHRLLDPLTERRLLGQGWTSRLLQAVLLDLLTRPASVAEVARARDAYAARRTAVVAALARSGVTVTADDGLNLWLPVVSETGALVELAGRGIGAAAGAPFATRPDDRAHLRVTVGLVPVEDATDVAAALAEAVRVPGWSGPR